MVEAGVVQAQGNLIADGEEQALFFIGEGSLAVPGDVQPADDPAMAG